MAYHETITGNDTGSVMTSVLGSGERPLFRDLCDYVVPLAATSWKELGVHLLDPKYQGELMIIEADYPQNAKKCCQIVLQKWLTTKVNATWGQLIQALQSPGLQLNYLASQIEILIKANEMNSNG